MRLVFLDSGPLGMLSHPHGNPLVLRCQQWALDLIAAGVRVVVPEIADYEVRRKLLHLGATVGACPAGPAQVGFDYAPITDGRDAPGGRALGRREAGRAADVIPGCTGRGLHPGRPGVLAADPGDVVTVATDNVGHLGRFVDARPWDQIVP